MDFVYTKVKLVTEASIGFEVVMDGLEAMMEGIKNRD